MADLLIQRAVLVYQAGIANVFEVENLAPGYSCNAENRGTTRRLLQGAFRDCENFAQGLRAAGTTITTMHCNEAGDITGRRWNPHDLMDAPFSENFRPVYSDGFEPAQ